MGGEANEVHLVTASGIENWPRLAKDEVARRLAAAHRRTPRGQPRVSVRVAVTRLPHGRDLPLPAYATDGAAGIDLLAAVADAR